MFGGHSNSQWCWGHDLCVNSALFVPPHQSLCDVLLKEGLCCLAILCEKQRIDFISKK